jgi:hypothetical protein
MQSKLLQKLEKLKRLRGEHDQTMRTQAVEIFFDGDSSSYETVTERFLEYLIHQVQDAAIIEGVIS